MKVRLLPLAIGAAVAMPGVALADGPTLYGKMNVTYEAVDYDAYDEVQLNSNASRLGVKGKEEISQNLSVIYQAEYDINVDDGGSAPFSQRDIFAGLEGGWGTFKVGKFDTPLKSSQGKIDQFNDMQFGDIGYLVVGEERVSNSLQYSTPSFGDVVTINVAWMPGEDGEPSGTPPVSGDDGAADSFSASVVFSNEHMYFALAMDDSIASTIKTSYDMYDDKTKWDTIRFTAGMYFSGFEAGFLYSTAETSDDAAPGFPEEQEAYVLSAGVKLGESNKLRFQYGFSDNDIMGATESIEITQYGIGFDHNLSKQSKLFANYIAEEGEMGSVSGDVSTFQLGMEHKF